MENFTQSPEKIERKPRFQLGAVFLLIWLFFRLLQSFLLPGYYGAALRTFLSPSLLLYFTASLFLAIVLLTKKRGVLLTVAFGLCLLVALFNLVLNYRGFFMRPSFVESFYFAADLLFVCALASFVMITVAEIAKLGVCRRVFGIVAIAAYGTYTFFSAVQMILFLSNPYGLALFSYIVVSLFCTAWWLITMRTVFPYAKSPAPRVAPAPAAPQPAYTAETAPEKEPAPERRIFCPACGKALLIPRDASSLYCIHCGQHINL